MTSVPTAAAATAHMPRAPRSMATSDEVALRERLKSYAHPHLGRSVADVFSSLLPYLALSVLMYFTLHVSYLLTLGLALPTAGFLVRTFVVFHDCTHGSFFPSKRANAWVGTALGLCTFSCFASWRQAHLVHHGTAGDLDRRGVGDLPTMTVTEYQALSRPARLAYRLFRNPVIMFGVGPFIALILQPRFVPRSARARIKRRVHGTNLALAALLAALCWLIGWQNFLLIEVPTVMIGGAVGIWLFFVQHQFDDVYWANTKDWNYADAALRGSSYLKLPKPLQFFTGNIGLHHVHHLNARIPNYNLQRAHDENPIFHGVPVLKLRGGLRAVRLKLYDTDQRAMVTFAQADAMKRPKSASDHVDAARLPALDSILKRAQDAGLDPKRVANALGASALASKQE